MRVIESSLISYHFFQKYRLSFLKDVYNDLTFRKTKTFFETEIGKETKDEYEKISQSFLSRYNSWQESLTGSRTQNH